MNSDETWIVFVNILLPALIFFLGQLGNFLGLVVLIKVFHVFIL